MQKQLLWKWNVCIAYPSNTYAYDIWFQFGICFVHFQKRRTQHNRIISYYLNAMFCFSNRPILASRIIRARTSAYMFTERKPSYHVNRTSCISASCVRACVRSVFPPKPNWNWTIVQMQSKCEIENGLMRDIKFNIDTLCACASFCHLAFIAMHVSQLVEAHQFARFVLNLCCFINNGG